MTQFSQVPNLVINLSRSPTLYVTFLKMSAPSKYTHRELENLTGQLKSLIA
jgi:hypothetical protein